ncbi:MAG: hypothetical protein U0893_06325 [Chloroflexota bacterium]
MEEIRYEGAPSMDRLDRGGAFRDELIGASFSSFLHRYVGLALLDDGLTKKENVKQGRTIPAAVGFARGGASELLDSSLEWLLAEMPSQAGSDTNWRNVTLN